MHIDASGHGSTYIFLRGGIADTGGMIIDQIALELPDLLIRQHDFRKFADTRVHPVHDLPGVNFFFQHPAAHFNAFQSLIGQSHRLMVPGNTD